MNANSVPEDVHRVRSDLVSQPVFALPQSLDTLPDLERIQLDEKALRTLQRKFGQPQAVVSAYLEKLSKYPPVKLHSSESIINFATVFLVFSNLLDTKPVRTAPVL